MNPSPFHVTQGIFRARHPQPQILVVPVLEVDASPAINTLVQTVTHGTIGLAAAYAEKCKLAALALASDSRVVIVRFPAGGKGKGKKGKSGANIISPGRKALQELILRDPTLRKLGWGLDRLVSSLYFDHHLLMTNGVDMSNLGPDKKSKSSFDDLVTSIGGADVLQDKTRLADVFNGDKFDINKLDKLALRAWIAFHAGTRTDAIPKLAGAPLYDTVMLPEAEVAVLAKIRRDYDRLDALKPTFQKNDVAATYSYKKGNLVLDLTRFKTRIRPSGNQHLQIHTPGTLTKNAVKGHAMNVQGKRANVAVKGVINSNASKLAVYTIGKDDPTSAEDARAYAVRLALQRQTGFLRLPFPQQIWFPNTPVVRGSQQLANKIGITFTERPLNASQRKAVESMLDQSAEKRLVVIHGGPGTGKTTVIAASVMSLIANQGKLRYIWLVAQSNVAVKNIAEKLAECNFFDFRLLVSKDFHYDWHEHLYERIEQNVIRSDTLEKNIVGVERQLGGATVILCTLSMLANQRIAQCGLTRVVPVQTVVVDEASQIELGDYVPLFHRYSSTLQKLICIGDDKQLPPYGQEDISDLKSIFELHYLRQNQVFLDTQYRMPIPIGTFISKHVYNNKLKSVHAIEARSCCRFVDISHGVETQVGHSWANEKEVQAVVHIARKLQKEQKSFRIITPYDLQRTKLENALKSAGLTWEDKCFNVDSFQGNEDDYIIISVVRTQKPGFLVSQRRTNVMLSRCKKGMIICANRNFLTGNALACNTLVGKLAAAWEKEGWISWQDLLSGRF